jgi:acetyl-CoA synthetase
MDDPKRSWQDFVREFREGAHVDFAEHWRMYGSLPSRLEDDFAQPEVWWPGEREMRGSNLSTLLEASRCESYRDLHRWSIEHREQFWQATIDRLGIRFDRPPDRVLDASAGVEHPVWLSGARFNIVDSCFLAPPAAPAIVHADEAAGEIETVTYAELERLVNRVANGLREHGLEPDEAVVLFMPMTVACVAAYLGVIRAGCRVVSVADSFSAAELLKRMQISEARWVVTMTSFTWSARRIELYARVRRAVDGLGGEARCIVIDDEDRAAELAGGDLAWEHFLSDTETFDSVIGSPDRVTNVLFSSGTTGLPKAIPWTQLAPLKCAMDGHFHQDIHTGDVVAWPTNIGWMMGPWLIYASLLNRASMALFAGAPNGRAFAEFVAHAGVTMLGLVPALVRAWRSRDLVAADAWPHIRTFSSTGEVSNPEDYLWLMSRAGYRAPVIEYLGGTEIGGGHITGSVLLPASPSTFNTPALGIDFVILGEDDQPVPAGALGELFLIPPSIGLSQTLLNADHHEVYYEGCPEGPGGEVLRRHGDEFHDLGDGTYRAQGRTDDTMNLGGIKVSSIELEEAINGHPAVFESAAIAVPLSGEGAESLVVYIVPAAKLDAETLQQDLGRRIADELNPMFKIHQIVVIDKLPRTASNKVMRRELRDQYCKR